MKLLVVNLQDPSQTKYRNPKNIGAFMCGRRFSNYPMFSVDENGTMNPITITTCYNDVIELQKQVLEQFTYTNRDAEYIISAISEDSGDTICSRSLIMLLQQMTERIYELECEIRKLNGEN